jgi:hypothetical protein
MKTHTSPHLSCTQCHFFQPEGHYYGNCSRMSVTVTGKWQACTLAVAAFGRSNQPQPLVA